MHFHFLIALTRFYIHVELVSNFFIFQSVNIYLCYILYSIDRWLKWFTRGEPWYSSGITPPRW